MTTPVVKKLDPYRWIIPRTGKMKTEGLVYADEIMLEAIQKDLSLDQVANVACLPGIAAFGVALTTLAQAVGR